MSSPNKETMEDISSRSSLGLSPSANETQEQESREDYRSGSSLGLSPETARTPVEESEDDAASSAVDVTSEAPKTSEPQSIEDATDPDMVLAFHAGNPEGDGTGQDGGVTVTTHRIRPPRNVKDVMRYCMEVQALQGEEASSEPNPVPSNMAEGQEFLEKVFNDRAMYDLDTIAQQLDIVISSNYGSVENTYMTCQAALKRIGLQMDFPAFSNAFYVMGGFLLLGPCLDSPHSCIRSQASEIVAQLAQTGILYQSRLFDLGILQILMNILENDHNNNVKCKALYAIRSMIKECDENMNFFLANGGISSMLRVLSTDHMKLTAKSAFVFIRILRERSNVRDDIIEMGFIEHVAKLLPDLFEQLKVDNDYDLATEHALHNLFILCVENKSTAIPLCLNPELRLRPLLISIRSFCNGKPEHREAFVFAEQLLYMLYHTVKPPEPPMPQSAFGIPESFVTPETSVLSESSEASSESIEVINHTESAESLNTLVLSQGTDFP